MQHSLALCWHRRPLGLLTKVCLKESDFGEKWPLTVSEGVLHCGNTLEGFQSVTFETLDGAFYAVNGTSRRDGFRNLKDIWRLHPRFPDGLWMNISPLLDLGLELCAE